MMTILLSLGWFFCRKECPFLFLNIVDIILTIHNTYGKLVHVYALYYFALFYEGSIRYSVIGNAYEEIDIDSTFIVWGE